MGGRTLTASSALIATTACSGACSASGSGSADGLTSSGRLEPLGSPGECECGCEWGAAGRMVLLGLLRRLRSHRRLANGAAAPSSACPTSSTPTERRRERRDSFGSRCDKERDDAPRATAGRVAWRNELGPGAGSGAGVGGACGCSEAAGWTWGSSLARAGGAVGWRSAAALGVLGGRLALDCVWPIGRRGA